MADDMTIHQIRSLLDSQSIARASEIQPAMSGAASAAAGAAGAPTFAETLEKSIAEVNDLKVQADKAIEDLATGQNGDLQGTILALEKADISFKLMMEVRNKIVSAYQEVMRTQV
jgi:flagellar hook-basal body complex protein FliE